jgi:hypothetical protein
MEFVLCIRFAFTKIQTAQFICVAQFVNDPESFLENRVDGKEKCSRKNENPFEACDARGKAVANLKPRTATD